MVSHTMAEKILSRSAGREVHSGEYVWASPDLIYIHDILGPLTYDVYRQMNEGKGFYTGKFVIVHDHIFPPKDIQSAENVQQMKQFSRELDAEFVKGGEGIEHTLLVERGIIKPGQLILGGDSHTVTSGAVGAMGIGMGSTDIAATLALGRNWFMVPDTMKIMLSGEYPEFVTSKDIILKILGEIGVNGANYRAMEFHSDDGLKLSLDDRLSLSNMTVEAGAKAGMCVPSDEVFRYYADMGENVEEILPDSSAKYFSQINLDVTDLRPQVARPFSPDNVVDVSEVKGIELDQVYIGNCANGTLSDLREAAEILKGSQVHSRVRLIVVPATRNIYKKALDEGLIKKLVDAGATIAPSTCGACAGLHMGVLGKGETALSNTNRNYRGRMGHPESRVYLSGTYVCAASAIEGKISDPREFA
ncbi:MAG: 3-isopropylmalate dehydratase large subunit [Candidatus Thermoplasmatota archaeon]|nr:3-isopropylmalate dehydratase large subunit [Candidatus Thermoplasmatota archaeon]